MKKLIAVSVISSGIALFALGCADHPAAPPMQAAPSRPSFGASTPFNNVGQCLGNDAIMWEEFVDGIDETSSPDDMSCTSNDVGVTVPPPCTSPRTRAPSAASSPGLWLDR